ncbi:MAG: hypothetical protein KBT68_06870 [bacterium]|nr:hypothetical protein [Candidatus Colisoma equi]
MNGTADPVVLDLMGDPLKTISLTGSGTVFNQTVNNASTSVKGGKIDVSGGNVYVGSSGSAAKNTEKKMFLSDGAEISGCGTFAVAGKEAGNILAMTNATISAANFYVSNGGCQGVNSVFAGRNAKISISGEFATEKEPTSKSTAGAVFRMAGADAEISAGTANIGAVSGTSFVVADGAKATFTTLNVGVKGYVEVSGVQVDVLNATMDVTGGLSFGKDADSMGHTLVVSGGSAVLNHTTTSKADIFGSGSDCHIIVKDGAELRFADVRHLFKSGTRGSTLEVLNGGRITATKSIYLGYGEKGAALDCAKNRLVVGSDASVTSTDGNVYVYDVNNELVVSNGVIATSGVYVGTDAKAGYNQSTNATLVIQGSSPKITGIRFSAVGVAPKIRFELARDGYSWLDEPSRSAPIEITVSKAANAINMVEGTVLEADVTRLAPARRGVPIPLITSDFAMSIPDSVIENANAKGAVDRYKYMFALSGDRKTLNLTVESRGLILVVQ